MTLLTHPTRHSRTARSREFARLHGFEDLFGPGSPGGVIGGVGRGSEAAPAGDGPLAAPGKVMRGAIVGGRVHQRLCRVAG